VRRGADIVGFVTPADIKTIDRAAWTQRTIGDLVPRVDAEHAVPPEAPAATALTLMGRENMQQVPVVANGHVEGVVTRAHLLQVLQLRAELS
jgi:CBS domain-containing protein